MTSETQLLNLLDRLTAAFPQPRQTSATLRVYLEHLADIPEPLLRRVVERQIHDSRWFPRLADIRACAARIAGTDDFSDWTPDPLAARAMALEQAFLFADELDLQAWESLAAEFESAGRPHRAARVRAHLAHFLAMQAGSAAGDARPPEELQAGQLTPPQGDHAATGTKRHRPYPIAARPAQRSRRRPRPVAGRAA